MNEWMLQLADALQKDGSQAVWLDNADQGINGDSGRKMIETATRLRAASKVIVAAEKVSETNTMFASDYYESVELIKTLKELRELTDG